MTRKAEIERLHREGCRLKAEILKRTGGERIPLTPQQRQRLAEKARIPRPTTPPGVARQRNRTMMHSGHKCKSSRPAEVVKCQWRSQGVVT